MEDAAMSKNDFIKNGGMPAMPLPIAMSEQECLTVNDYEGNKESGGLTKREHFAGLAMQGILSNNDWIAVGWEDTARRAINAADTLLKELEK